MQHEFRRLLGLMCVAAALSGSALALMPARVAACGGLFCNSNRAIAVNQAAEQIIFSKNADGTVTAVIQIMYEGQASKFAWVLPVPGVPTVAVSSDQAFATLKAGTNPSYQLQYQSTCTAPSGGFANTGTATSAPAAKGAEAGPSVQVLASGAIGPYDYDVIMVNPSISDRAQVAVDWLTMHSYDVGPMGADLLRPYLMDDLNLIAFKLTKSATTGSIRPVMLTYQAALPSIPIRPTAVAANDDMGVLVWVLSDARAIPQNYKALELNDALIDWFMPNNNYNRVVSLAADEAMGQGFVTEFAGKTTQFKKDSGTAIFSTYQQSSWDSFSAATYPDALTMIRTANMSWGGYDGFDDALQASVTLPTTIAFNDFKNCLACYITAQGVTFDQTLFLRQLYEKVIKPMADTQALFDSAQYVTRLYTTMSAEEMTTDPAFDFNKDLADVSNLHTATITTGCGGVGPWTATLATGDKVSGTTMGVWPIKVGDQPAARKILEYGKQGEGKVIEDRSAMIEKLLKAGFAAPAGTGGSSGGTGGTSGGGKAGTGATTSGAAGSGSKPTGNADAGTSSGTASDTKHSGGCAVAAGGSGGAALWLLATGLVLAARRRRLTTTSC